MKNSRTVAITLSCWEAVSSVCMGRERTDEAKLSATSNDPAGWAIGVNASCRCKGKG